METSKKMPKKKKEMTLLQWLDFMHTEEYKLLSDFFKWIDSHNENITNENAYQLYKKYIRSHKQ